MKGSYDFYKYRHHNGTERDSETCKNRLGGIMQKSFRIKMHEPAHHIIEASSRQKRNGRRNQNDSRRRFYDSRDDLAVCADGKHGDKNRFENTRARISQIYGYGCGDCSAERCVKKLGARHFQDNAKAKSAEYTGYRFKHKIRC